MTNYSMYRQDDGVGDSGPLSDALYLTEDKSDVIYEHNAVPRVGVCMRVGSLTARSFTAHDWWQTSYITEILEEENSTDYHRVKFKTKNSIYIWTRFL